MTKQDIIEHLIFSCGLHRASAIAAVNGMIKAMTRALSTGEDITLHGFATFKIYTMAEKKAQDIRRKQTITLPAHKRAKAIFCSEIRNSLKALPVK